MSENERIIRAFAAQFDPPLAVCRTERVNNLPVRDAWQAATWSTARQMGVMAVAYGNGLHAYIEAAGDSSVAEDAGKVMASALGLSRKD